MNITVFCSSESHPINKALNEWIHINSKQHTINMVRRKSELMEGDLLLLISCTEIITVQERNRFIKTLVIHASDLPKGRGWSPHIWEIIGGATNMTVSLLEAQDKVDSGAIWKKCNVDVPKHTLYDEINSLLFSAELALMDYAVENFHAAQPNKQPDDIAATYYPRRKIEDSELDPNQSIASQFELLRVCDPVRFPAFFELHGHKYKLIIEKFKDE